MLHIATSSGVIPHSGLVEREAIVANHAYGCWHAFSERRVDSTNTTPCPPLLPFPLTCALRDRPVQDRSLQTQSVRTASGEQSCMLRKGTSAHRSRRRCIDAPTRPFALPLCWGWWPPCSPDEDHTLTVNRRSDVRFQLPCVGHITDGHRPTEEGETPSVARQQLHVPDLLKWSPHG